VNLGAMTLMETVVGMMHCTQIVAHSKLLYSVWCKDKSILNNRNVVVSLSKYSASFLHWTLKQAMQKHQKELGCC